MISFSLFFKRGWGVVKFSKKKKKINGHAILWNNFYVNKEYLKKKKIKLHDWLKNKTEFIDKGYPQKCGHHKYF